MQNVTDAINKISTFLEINPEVQFVKFLDRAKIPKNRRGIYIILQDQLVIYVGKGDIASRNQKHVGKMEGDPNVSLPAGWRWLIETQNPNHKNWNMVMVYLDRLDEESAMEGNLIYMLKPLVNDEIYKQNMQING